MAEYVGSESELRHDELIRAVTNSKVQTNQKMQNIAETRPGNNDQNPDKFSELTPLVFYHILSFLGVIDLARLCIVSTRLLERCISSPDILFDVNLYEEYVDVNLYEESCASKCRGLRNLLEKLLDVRSLRMNFFRLHWHYHECKDFSPTSWMKRAVVCNAQEIDIGFFPGQVDFILPDCLCGASLTILRLNLQGGRLNCQSKYQFPSIQVLSLSSIWVPSGFGVGEWISSNFASLKTLRLEKIHLRESLVITSSSIECLTISHCLIGPGTRHTEIYVKCTSLNHLLVHYCRLQSVCLSITCPSLKDLQITKCSNVTYVCTEISAEALRTLSIDMTFFTSRPGMFSIIRRSLLNLERITLKLELHDELHDESDEFRAPSCWRKCLLLLGSLNYMYKLEIDIGTISILILKEVVVRLPNLHHLEVTIDNLQELHATNIAMFISDICSASNDLRTLTIIYEECQSDLVFLNIVGSLESCVGREIPAAIEITWLKRPKTIARDKELTCLCASCILSAV